MSQNPALSSGFTGAIMRRRYLLLSFAGFLLTSAATQAQTIYPVDRAEMLVDARFDFKVEFSRIVKPEEVAISINGQDYARLFGVSATFIAREEDKDQSALLLRDVTLSRPGNYKVKIAVGQQVREITW